VNAEATCADNIEDFCKANLTAVVFFFGSARNEAAIVNGEDERIEKFLVAAIEWDVDEHALAAAGQPANQLGSISLRRTSSLRSSSSWSRPSLPVDY
jgi:hypothetical protein